MFLSLHLLTMYCNTNMSSQGPLQKYNSQAANMCFWVIADAAAPEAIIGFDKWTSGIS